MNGESNEIGIWVSGFYGSGKSSFAKYLGYGLQKGFMVDNQLFLDRLSNRINDVSTTQLFKNIVSNFDPAVIFIDCATEQFGDLPPIIDLLIAKVSEKAGFSPDSKLADLERMLIKDGNLEKFIERIKIEHQENWDDIKIKYLTKAKGIAAILERV